MKAIRALISDAIDDDEPTLFLGSDDGEFDDAIIGITRCNGIPILLYDTEKVIACLVEMGMTIESAWDWFYHNIECTYMGLGTPMYVTTVEVLREQH